SAIVAARIGKSVQNLNNFNASTREFSLIIDYITNDRAISSIYQFNSTSLLEITSGINEYGLESVPEFSSVV
ncbi:MAG: hypothetical protein JW941_09345, partial [Candidatus Coatesbacteria bacterium]|nr:hypothetical protein [Candidatus Coatesbacteria bacterium]